jgi:hypothetical protein
MENAIAPLLCAVCVTHLVLEADVPVRAVAERLITRPSAAAKRLSLSPVIGFAVA